MRNHKIPMVVLAGGGMMNTSLLLFGGERGRVEQSINSAQGVPSPLAPSKGWRLLMWSGDRYYLGSLVTCPGVVEVSAAC